MADTAQPDSVSRLMSLMEGYAQAFGRYDATQTSEAKGGKLEIRATAQTVHKPVTKELWQAHVAGRNPLGIIPIRDNNTCLWGAIDVDTYDLSMGDVVKKVEDSKLPLTPCRSKSGGIHLFLFVTDPVPAVVMQSRLKEMAAILGFGGSEVFPKQREVNWDRGDMGSWLNMPYFGGDGTDRYALKSTGLGLSLAEFLDKAEGLKQTPAYLHEKIKRSKKEDERERPERDPDFGDGPPCMQHLAETGIPDGMRNQGLFAFATFAKRKYGTRWKEVVERWNREHVHPPLGAEEVLQILKSHERKEYNYKCKEQPICAHCNSSLCRTRKFGVGGDDDYPVVSGLRVLESDPPLWFMDVDDTQIELSTEELQNYRLFHKKCMEKLFICYRMMKNDDWLRVVATAMRDAVRLESREDISLDGQFIEHLEEFLVSKHRGTMREDILVGRPWLDEDGAVPGAGGQRRHYFQFKDLKKYLDTQKFTGLNDAQIATRIADMGGGKHFFNIKNKGRNVWWVPDVFIVTPALPLPALEEEPI